MTQAELFNIRDAGNLKVYEPVVGRITQLTTMPGKLGDNKNELLNDVATRKDFSPISPAGQKEPLPPFAAGSETSRQAAIAKYDAGTAPSQREMIYRLIRFAGEKGLTRDEIEDRLKLSGNTVRPRVKELLGEAKDWPDPLIRRNGQMRETKSGINAEVLVVI